jgi:hypothetical protein
MRLPRFRVRTLLIVVAVAAVLLGAGIEYLRMRRLSDRYRYYAWVYGENVRMRLQDLARLKQKWAQLRTSPNRDPVEVELLGVSIESIEANIAANANIVQIYEHGTDHPWETLHRPAEPFNSVVNYPIPRRYLTNAPPPKPYRPPDIFP